MAKCSTGVCDTDSASIFVGELGKASFGVIINLLIIHPLLFATWTDLFSSLTCEQAVAYNSFVSSFPEDGLRLYYLGTPRIELNGHELKPGFRKALALLIYLSLAKEKQRRESLMNLLWPDDSEQKARAALRDAIYSIRKVLPGTWLTADRHEVGIENELNIWCDVEEFLNAVSRISDHDHADAMLCDECRMRLEAAIQLYRGDFLAGFGLKDSENFDDWQFFQTETLRQSLANALEAITRCYIETGDYRDAGTYARKWLSLDPMNEAAHRCLMRIGAWTGNRGAAVRQYRDCVRILDEELGVEPYESTRALFETINNEELTADVHREVSEAPGPPGPPEASVDTYDARPGAARPSLEEPDAEKHYVVTVVLGLQWGGKDTGASKPNIAEEDTAAIRTFRISAQTIIARYGGTMHNAHAECVVAIFGGEQTRENDPDLALCAVLELQKSEIQGGYSVAAGASTGWAFFSGSSVFGKVVRVATMLYGKAGPDRLLVDEASYRHTRLAFETQPYEGDYGERSESDRWYEVVRRLPESNTPREKVSSSLVGRTRDVEDLEKAAVKWLAGQGQVALISGEAGIGKSRLAAELITRAKERSERVLFLVGRCVSSDHPISYWPFLDMIRSYFGLRDGDRSEEMQRKISAGIRLLNVPSEAAMNAYIANVLSVPLSPSAAKELEHKSPDQMRLGTLESLRNLFEHIGRRAKLLLVLEDLHWADDLTFDLLTLLLDSLPSSAVFIVCLFRPEAASRTAQLSLIARRKCFDRCTELQLNRLHDEDALRLIENLLDGARPSDAAVELILSKSEGVPFFVEEIVRSFIEKSVLSKRAGSWEFDESLTEIEVPDTIQSVISARIGMLSTEDRAFLRYASVVGQFFKLRLAAHFSDDGERLGGQLGERIRVCVERDLIYEERRIPEVEYAFRHAYTQEATYEEIPEETRSELHRRVAIDIERLYEGRLEEWYETLAFHYSKSGDVDGSIDYLLKSGQKTIRSTDIKTAIVFLRRGLGYIEKIADIEHRRAIEIEYRIALGGALAVAHGYFAPEVADNYNRTRALCLDAESTPHLFEALHGLTSYYLVKGDLRSCSELADEQMRHSEQLGRSEYHVEARLSVGLCSMFRGQLQRGRPHIEKALAMYDEKEHEHLAFLYGHDPAIAGTAQFAMGLWTEGYPDQARNMCDRCIGFSRKKNHPPSLGMAYALVPITYQCLREPLAVLSFGEKMAAHSKQFDLPLWVLLGSIMYAWARKDVEQLRQLIGALQASGIELFTGYYTMILAELVGKSRSVEEGLVILRQAQSIVEKNDERLFEPELYRIEGDLIRMQGEDNPTGTDAAAETCYRRSLDIAQKMGARSLELKTATSLGGLLREQNRLKEARDLITSAYNQMTEGFDTSDLVDARYLIDELSKSDTETR